jgi:hypothetical protein
VLDRHQDCQQPAKIVADQLRVGEICGESRTTRDDALLSFVERTHYNLGTPDQSPETISMKKISIAFLAAMSLASFGCKKKGGSGEAIAKMTEFKDKMCACKDKACTDKVSEDMTKWGQEQAKNAGDKAAAVSEEDTKKMAAVTEEMTKCMTKIMTDAAAAAAPPAAPAAPAAGSDTAAPAAGSAAPAAGSADGSAAAAPAAGSADGSAAGSAK